MASSRRTATLYRASLPAAPNQPREHANDRQGLFDERSGVKSSDTRSTGVQLSRGRSSWGLSSESSSPPAIHRRYRFNPETACLGAQRGATDGCGTGRAGSESLRPSLLRRRRFERGVIALGFNLPGQRTHLWRRGGFLLPRTGRGFPLRRLQATTELRRQHGEAPTFSLKL
jgi:hypothetical protein